jgi:hypothetical protein
MAPLSVVQTSSDETFSALSKQKFYQNFDDCSLTVLFVLLLVIN